jgi:hypothetical protein
MKILDISEDSKRKCFSMITKMTLREYYDLAKKSFDENGSLEGQRGVIKKSAAAARIRKRMHEDFSKGAIFPQVVIGVTQSTKEFKNFSSGMETSIDCFKGKNISIIDGMQRSNIYFSNFVGNEDREIRVEFWVADDSVQLLYRMLVLNTGQTPWNTRRQVEVVFSNLAKSIEDELHKQHPDYKEMVKIAQIDENKKRTQAGIYPLNSVIEMYLGFNTRNVKVQVSDELSEEYQRFDMMESIEMSDSLKYFVTSFGLMCKLDFCLANNISNIGDKRQFGEGKDIFASAPVRMGFIVACAETILGKISTKRTSEDMENRKNRLCDQIDVIVEKIDKEKDNPNFMELELLNDVCDKLPKTRFGDEMRRLFKNIFVEIFRDDSFAESTSMEPFWRV